MKSILFEITDWLGWLFFEASFKIDRAFDFEGTNIITKVSELSYMVGCKFYSAYDD